RPRMPHRTAYFCGDWIPDDQIAIAPDDRGFSMGVTATERLRTFGGSVFRNAPNPYPLAASLQAIGPSVDSLVPEIAQASGQFVARHRDQWREGDDWAIVLFATPGRGTGPTTCVHGFPLHFAEWADHYATGVSLQFSDH